jgi:hypothetical protein
VVEGKEDGFTVPESVVMEKKSNNRMSEVIEESSIYPEETKGDY